MINDIILLYFQDDEKVMKMLVTRCLNSVIAFRGFIKEVEESCGHL